MTINQLLKKYQRIQKQYELVPVGEIISDLYAAKLQVKAYGLDKK